MSTANLDRFQSIFMDETAPYGTYSPSGIARWAIEHTRMLPDSWAGRRLTFILRRLAIASLKGAPVDIEALGARMRLYPYNNIGEKRVLFTPQFFDPEELAVLKGRIAPGFIFIDVGASIGAYSLAVASFAGPSARILAVEPHPDTFDRLTYNIGLNPFGTVKAVACAIADKPGDLTLFLDPRNSGQSSVKIVGVSEATIRVPATTLLQLVRNERLDRLDAVKVDVEGAEDLILEPFLRDAPPELYPSLIVLGSRDWQTDLLGLLAARGYRMRGRTRMNFVLERT